MTVSLYNCSDAYNVLNKTFGTAVASVTAQLKGAVDIDNPTFLLDYSSSDFNYFSAFGRYYTVTGRQLMPGDQILVSGQSDPLSSFAAPIGELDVLVVRSEDPLLRNPDIVDNAIPMPNDVQYEYIPGEFTMGSENYIIGVC